MNELEKQLRKGVLQILVLRWIEREPQYGYRLIQTLREASDGYFDLKEGTLYPIFYRLEDSGLIESQWSEAAGRSTSKKYYQITEKGRSELKTLQSTWNAFSSKVNELLSNERDDQ